MNPDDPPVPADSPPAPTPGQMAMLNAYQRSRALFDRIEAGEAFASVVHTSNARLIRYRRERQPFESEAHEAIRLVGALARLAGGQTLGEVGDPITVADYTGGLSETLLATTYVAALHCLAIGPILDVALELVSAYPAEAASDGANLMTACIDLATIAGAHPASRPAGPEGAEALRRAMFASLGQIITCAWVEFGRRIDEVVGRPLAPDETPALYFAAAVSMMLGAGAHHAR